MAFHILVDYDNILPEEKKKGLYYIAEKLIKLLDSKDITGLTHNITIRLYGGWYLNESLTKRAQDLAAEIPNLFPEKYMLMDGKTEVVVAVEIAYSLVAYPLQHLHFTYRKRGIPEGLKANNPQDKGCTQSPCPILTVYDFVKNGKCVECGIMTKEAIFYRGEQKLVDTMITADLIYLSTISDALCLVSSDDDMWPGMITAIASGKRIIHIPTRAGQSVYNYSKTVNFNYVKKTY